MHKVKTQSGDVKLQWVKGNAKLKKTEKLIGAKIVGFSIPPDFKFTGADGRNYNTCPQASTCANVCYAKQGRYMMPNVVDSRIRALECAESEGFEAALNRDLNEFKKKSKIVVRLHDSGDFYKQSYLDVWSRVAENHEDIIFYAYTKSHHLDYSKAPKNLHIIQSLGGVRDDLIDESRPHCRIFTSEEEMKAAGYVDGGGEEGDIPAIRMDHKIGIVYHGTRNLTEENKNAIQIVQIGVRGARRTEG